MTKLPCYIIKDLLPSYIEQLCTEETNAQVKEHLGECENCRLLLDDMKAVIPTPEPVSTSEDIKKRELQHLSKTWKRSKYHEWIKAICVSTGIIALLLGFLLLFNHQSPFPVKEQSVQVNDLCMSKDGSVVFEIEPTGPWMWSIVHGGLQEDNTTDFYITPYYNVVPHTKGQEYTPGATTDAITGEPLLYTHYLAIDVDNTASQSQRLTPLQRIYIGTPTQRRLIWERGQQLEKATPQLESEYATIMKW
ncbi:MAG: zf-HC2 domain-containing protein [Lachnospiraceae bacterium]